ncbi:hypothetical protein L1887_22147 [Cichorium endivia]|nr:hypothetical protein L1887_22147 [Cichorium endivia]
MEWYCWVGLFSSYVLNCRKKNKFWLEFCLFETFGFWNAFWLISGSLFYNSKCLLFSFYFLVSTNNVRECAKSRDLRGCG